MEEDGPLTVDTGRGLSLTYRGRAIYSRRAPLEAPLRAAAQAPLFEQALYLVPSPCLCHGLAELAARIPKSSAVLCVEADQNLMACALEASRELLLVRPDIRLIRSNDIHAVRAYARSIAAFRRVVQVRLSAGYELNRDFYDSLERSLTADAVLSMRNRVTLARMSRLWTRNLVSNLSAMPWDEVTSAQADDSATVVCGAGPSLDAALPFIRAHADRLRVVACDTACGALARAGIRPDTVVALEGQVYNLPDFLPLNGAETMLFADLSAHPSTFRATRGAKVLLGSAWSDSSLHARLAESGLPIIAMPPLGSVGVLALRVARTFHTGPVFVAGLDFSFRPGRTHCSNSPADIAEGRREGRLYRRNSGWAASRREGVFRLDSGELCDPALSMYASLAAEELRAASASGQGPYDLRRGTGHPLPFAAVSEREAGSIADSSPAPRRVLRKAGGESAKAWAAAARLFLEGELAAVTDLRGALRSGCGRERLSALLSRLDYVYGHFPDPERVESLEQDALNRVAAECAYWEGRLRVGLDRQADGR